MWLYDVAWVVYLNRNNKIPGGFVTLINCHTINWSTRTNICEFVIIIFDVNDQRLDRAEHRGILVTPLFLMPFNSSTVRSDLPDSYTHLWEIQNCLTTIHGIYLCENKSEAKHSKPRLKFRTDTRHRESGRDNRSRSSNAIFMHVIGCGGKIV